MGRIQTIEDMPYERRIALGIDLATADTRERTATAQLRLMLHGGDLARLLGVPRISAARFEFTVPGGRIDLLLFHCDGSVSIIETKPEANPVQIAAGIGQLCMYAKLLPQVLSPHQTPTAIRRILCAAIAPEKCTDLIPACAMAGVRFVPLPTLATVRAILKRVESTASSEAGSV